jgi:hypothetical protein
MLRNYQLENGALPPSLDTLTPKYLEKVPLDAWRHPLVYTIEPDGGFTLTSWGANGVPGGRWGSDDIWCRLRRARAGEASEGGWVVREDTDPEPR